MGKVFQRIMKIGCLLRIIQYQNMVQLFTIRVRKQGTHYKFGTASL